MKIKALNKDILRTIWKEKKRFISIMMITTLGVTVMTGLSAGCQDLKMSADRFYDEQELFDVSVLSTLGLTDEDVEVLQTLDGVEKAEGSFSEVVHTKKGDLNRTAEVKVVREGGLNLPYVVEGKLPQTADEIVVTKNYIADTGKKIGDTVVIEELMEEEEDVVNTGDSEAVIDNDKDSELDTEELEIEIEEEVETPNFPNTTFTITGVVIDVMDVNNADGSAGFRATPNADYTFFVTPQAVESDVYTAVYLALEGSDELLCYSVEYEQKTAAVIAMIENQIMEQREKARFDAITGEAYEKIGDAEEEMNEKFAEVEQEFADAEEEIRDGWAELTDGKTELVDKEQEVNQEIADARKEIEDGYIKLQDGLEELKAAEYELSAGEQQLISGKQELIKQEENMKIQLQDAQNLLDSKIGENEAAKQSLQANLKTIQELFGEEWTKEDGLHVEWDAYVEAIEDVMLPIIKQQGNSGAVESENSEEQMQQLIQLLEQNPEYVTARDAFVGKVMAVTAGMAAPLEAQKAEMTAQLSVLEGQVAALQTELSTLESDKTALETEKITLESEKTRLEEEKAALENGNLVTQNGNPSVDDESVSTNNENTDFDTQIAELENRITEITEKIEEKETQIVVKTTELQTVVTTKATLEATIAASFPVLEEHLAGISQLQQQIPNLMQLAIGIAQTEAATVVLNDSYNQFWAQKASAEEQIADAWKQLEAGEQDIAHGKYQLAEARKEIDENRQKLDDGVAELNENEQKAREEFADAWAELADGEIELQDGEVKLAENRVEYEEKKIDALEKIEEAKAEVADIDMTQWYVQDRTSLSGYVNVDTDAECIESLADVFSIVFFIIAILISLTTVTRMVEEERGLIGTYKALGFTDSEIRKKYAAYALTASVLGGILGDVGGFVILPEILFIFFDVMYMLPAYFLEFNFVSGTVSVILFIIGITGAAYVACHAELKHLPAHLMRPKSPKMGSRVFLEYITPLWKRFSFLNKVTARNLFRYKKRFFMTVFGIMGCTALLVFGFAIKDSVSELMPMQYENIYKYDLLAAASADDNDKLTAYMENNDEVADYLNIQVESVKLKNPENKVEKVQILIFPEGASLEKYLSILNTELKKVELSEEGIYLTENAAKILDLEKGETVAIQKLNLEQEETFIADIVKNYLGNNIYMSQKAYEKTFGEYEPNGILANLSEVCTDQIAFSDKLSEEDWILSSISTEDLKAGFSTAFTLINIVVYVVLVLAAGLAFVVLFTLASVNISERIRELATIKVLGFFDREVHSYVNKETLILTGIGILLGLPLGTMLSATLTAILNLPSIYFAVTIYDRSYFFSAGLAMFFALLVQLMTDRTLDVIAPAEALKSVE